MANYNVIVNEQDYIIVQTGIQGPPGVGAGTAIVQDFAPAGGSIGQLWFNDNTQQLTIYTTQWTNQALDAGWY